MTILTTGIWTNKMLAEWFGIKESTFRSKKKQKLEELKEYAEFYEEKCKVIITKILDPGPYIQHRTRESIRYKVEEVFDEVYVIGETAESCARKIQKRLGASEENLETIIKYVGDIRIKKYGKTILPKKEIFSIEKINGSKGILDNAYIYSFWYKEEILYIGKTNRPVEQRLREHLKAAYDEKRNDYFYQALREIGEKNINIKILYESHGAIDNFQLECLECGYITYYKPKWNYIGVKVPYRFGK